MKLSGKEIVRILNASVSKIDFEIEQLLFDSRQLINPEKSLFFAFKSIHNNGHHYIPDLIAKGVKAFVVNEKKWKDRYPNVAILVVEDVLQALQKIAVDHRAKFDLPVIAITGSNGKTITKEWLADILSSEFDVVKNPKSYNSQIGVPFSISLIEDANELGIFEAGISKPGEMENLQKIIKPKLGIFTNIGSAHDAGFESQVQKVEEKANLFSDCDLVIYCKDHEAIDDYLQANKIPSLCWSKKQKTELRIITTKQEKKCTLIQFEYKALTQVLSIPFIDEASIENLMHCLLMALHLDIPLPTIQKKVNGLKPIEMRLQVLAGENNCIIINDTYNSDLESLTVALQFLKSQKIKKDRVLVLSDFMQFGDQPLNFYKKVAAIINENKIDKLFTVGQQIIQSDPFLNPKIERRHFENTEILDLHFEQHKLINAQVLIKGSRKFAFEKISNGLIKKQHQAVLEINLSALANNYDFFKNKLASSTKMLCMVKASGYGSGGIEIAKVLSNKHCDYLGVAYVDEGIELREAGIELPILVLNADPSSIKRLLTYDLEPEIYSINHLQKFIDALPLSTSLNIHLKIDTGMHRLGFAEEEIPLLINMLKKHKQLKIKGVMSHLAASESSEEDSFSSLQAKRFKKASDLIKKAFPIDFMRHLVNSAGILRFPQYHFDLVRLGIGLYGIDPMNKEDLGLETVLSLKASISQIKTIEAGETVGYSRKGKAQKQTKIAIVNIGYADGLLRKAGNGNFSLLVNGQKAPTFGNICMDMCMIDITSIENVKEGDEILIFGAELPVGHLSKVLDTIPYEIFTSISERVKRVYYQE